MADIEKIQPMGDSTQYTLRARTDSDGNVIVNKYVTLDTSQTISGGKAFTGSVTIRNNGRWPYLEYKPNTSSTTTCMVIWGGTDESGNITDSTLEFRLMSPSSTLNTNIGSHFEGYKLPSVNKDRTTDIWYNILTEKNYNDYAPTKTGGGASGTWGISITGSAPWGNITGKPSTYPPSSHTHAYMPFTIVTSSINFNDYTTDGIYFIRAGGNTNYATTEGNHGVLFVCFSIGTPFQLFLGDSSINYFRKRYYSGGAWSAWFTMGAAWS